MIQAVLSNGTLPDAVAAKALAYIRSELLSSDDSDRQKCAKSSAQQSGLPMAQGLASAKNRMNHQEVPILEEYNFNLPSTAYHCGGLMAVYAAIQKGCDA